METTSKYFYMTLMIIQGVLIFLYLTNINILYIVSWIGIGSEVNLIKLFSPLIVYGSIKILYWLADPLSKLFNIILRWLVIIGIVYLFYYIFFIQ